MGFQLSYFKSWKMMLWKCCPQYASKFGKLSSGHRTGKCQFPLQSQRKATTKECSSSFQFSHSIMPDSFWPHGLQHTRLPCLSPTPGAYSNSCSSRWWCHPTISSSVIPFSSRLQSFPASGSFPMSQFFTSGGFSFSISPSNEYSGLISFRMDWVDLLEVQVTLRVFSNTTVQKHQFFSPQLSLQSNSHIHTWPLEKA